MADGRVDPGESRLLITPLVKGLTRAPTVLGIPYELAGFIGVLTAVVFLATHNLVMLCICVPLYAVARIAIMRDPMFIEIMFIRSRKTPPRSASFWGARSYRV